MTPAHAISIWLSNDQIMVAYPDGQLIPIPSNEPARLLTILRAQEAQTIPVKKLLLYPTVYPTNPRPVVDGKRAAKAEAEKRARMKRIERRDRAAADTQLLNMLGL